MSTIGEIEAALSALSAEELRRVEGVLHTLRQQKEATNEVAGLERRNGFDPLPERAGRPVTTELVRQLCSEEGI